MLIDDVSIEVIAGKGGDGAILFNKTKMNLGPTGGDGGNGGNVYLEGVANIGALRPYRHRKLFRAEDGKMGAQKRWKGKDGQDLVLNVPIGTMVENLLTKELHEVSKIGQRLLIAKGGQSGRGNYSFRSATNTSPKQSTPGKEGEQISLHLVLKLIADVGLVGFPNAGKSSLLNTLTNANSRVANYPFTTLEPNLGAYYELIIADIPGLIEGASYGKGLGIKFLKHIERTSILFHLISAEAENPAKDYLLIREELRRYSPKLLEKKEYLFLSKCDLAPPAVIAEKLKQLKKLNVTAKAISVIDDKSMKTVLRLLNSLKNKKLEPDKE